MENETLRSKAIRTLRVHCASVDATRARYVNLQYIPFTIKKSLTNYLDKPHPDTGQVQFLRFGQFLKIEIHKLKSIERQSGCISPTCAIIMEAYKSGKSFLDLFMFILSENLEDLRDEMIRMWPEVYNDWQTAHEGCDAEGEESSWLSSSHSNTEKRDDEWFNALSKTKTYTKSEISDSNNEHYPMADVLGISRESSSRVVLGNNIEVEVTVHKENETDATELKTLQEPWACESDRNCMNMLGDPQHTNLKTLAVQYSERLSQSESLENQEIRESNLMDSNDNYPPSSSSSSLVCTEDTYGNSSENAEDDLPNGTDSYSYLIQQCVLFTRSRYILICSSGENFVMDMIKDLTLRLYQRKLPFYVEMINEIRCYPKLNQAEYNKMSDDYLKWLKDIFKMASVVLVILTDSFKRYIKNSKWTKWMTKSKDHRHHQIYLCRLIESRESNCKILTITDRNGIKKPKWLPKPELNIRDSNLEELSNKLTELSLLV